MSAELDGAEALDRGRRLARRRMAWLSFAFLVFFGLMTTYGLTFSPARESFAAALSVATVPVTGLLTVFTSIVLGYLGVSVVEQMFKK